MKPTISASSRLVAQMIALFSAYLAVTIVSAATMSTQRVSDDECRVGVKGAIQSGDDTKILSTILEVASARPTKCTTLRVDLDSPGGDIATAMEMGRILRWNEAIANVPEDSRCASACVLVLAGAIERYPIGQIAIHRPYSPGTGMRSDGEILAERSAMRAAIASYLEEVDVSMALLDAMDSVPPERARTLSFDELELYRLDGVDPATQERYNTIDAENLGMSREEYVRRRAECESTIRVRDAYRQCRHNLRNGLPWK